jgi:hypothetical protein
MIRFFGVVQLTMEHLRSVAVINGSGLLSATFVQASKFLYGFFFSSMLFDYYLDDANLANFLMAVKPLNKPLVKEIEEYAISDEQYLFFWSLFFEEKKKNNR